MKAASRRSWDLWAILFVLVGLYWFAASFFLAKRSLEQVSLCDEAVSLLKEQLGLSTEAIHTLQRRRIISTSEDLHRQGCWMDRRVDSLIILLVDALRFDFAYYNLPDSIGHRLQQVNSTSRLFQFIADPPTVTMQRLKALTTGGLPTFADISGNFGGAKVPEDTWVKQLLNATNYRSRGLNFGAKVGFVGDDTWEDLFPNYFTESYPYPSFNTRDLDTVDNGCFRRLPGLLQKLRTSDEAETELEVVIVHFLGVDHVGHTYGPHNQHMDAKLRQMDSALQSVLQRIDDSDDCHSALIFGDHGMTEDGNHGGGTMEETHAALFVHTSPSCGTMTNAAHLEQKTSSEWVSQSFATLHQIDLVPVISTLLGLPIPFANVGGLIPSILPGLNVQQMTAALALNAAQVWRYLTVYSETANRLPDLNLLQDRLQVAVASFNSALQQHQDDDDDKYLEASGLFKVFLTDALDLGQRVWTRFDNVGMVCGIFGLLIGLLLYAVPLWLPQYQTPLFRSPMSHMLELIATVVFILFSCGMLSFSNSYILKEEKAIMFSIAVLSCILALRLQSDSGKSTLARGVVLLPIASRVNELFISGHGMDPSVRIHAAHNAVVFLSSLLALGTFRWFLYQKRITPSFGQMMADCMALIFFALSWWEKRSVDPDRSGFGYCRAGLALIFSSFVLALPIAFMKSVLRDSGGKKRPLKPDLVGDVITIIAKLLIVTMVVTGPSAASSLVLYTIQATIVYCLALTKRPTQVHSIVVAGLWRLITRHIFFATNHGCYFNRLQYSAAFIATKEFYFALGGISLFLNTFGWEMVGIVFAWLMSQIIGRNQIWRAYGLYQLIEALASCISVCVLRRHLMVWDIYAPHFLFAAIYTVLHMLSQLSVLVMTN